MKKEKVIMSNWLKIWNNKKVNQIKLSSDSIEELFMELKRLTGNDTVKNGGVPYNSFIKQFNRFIEISNNFSTCNNSSFFEVGCGSAPYLFLLDKQGLKVGGVDYAQCLIDVARKILPCPKELYCDEAINLKTDIKYDVVFSTSAFEYFADENYAKDVLNKMLLKSKSVICILDVHDNEKKDDYLSYRRSIIPDYDKKYRDLNKLFLNKEFFLQFARDNDLNIFIEESMLENYWNKDFVFDVYMFKRR